MTDDEGVTPLARAWMQRGHEHLGDERGVTYPFLDRDSHLSGVTDTPLSVVSTEVAP